MARPPRRAARPAPSPKDSPRPRFPTPAASTRSASHDRVHAIAVTGWRTSTRLRPAALSGSTTARATSRVGIERLGRAHAAVAASVLRDLCVLRLTRELSLGEREMLDTARGLLTRSSPSPTPSARAGRRLLVVKRPPMNRVTVLADAHGTYDAGAQRWQIPSRSRARRRH